MNTKIIGLATLVSTLAATGITHAEVPNIFADGEPAVAAEVNENFSTLDTRVSGLENASSTINVAVDCTTDSINTAINNAPSAGQLNINISGACTESVVISRSNTSLIGDVTSASITFDSTVTSNPVFPTLNNTISIIGAQNVIIDNLAVNGATNTVGLNTGSGISVLHGSSALIKSSTITGNYAGIRVKGATARLKDNTLNNNSRAGLFVLDSGFAQLTGGNVITQQSPIGVSRNYAIGVFRNGTVLVSGANTVSASPTSDNNAISASYGAQFRAFYGLLTVNGNSTVGDDSELNFRDVVYTGNISVGNKGGLRFQNRPDQTLNAVTMIGNVTVNSLALVGISGLSPSSSGTVTCNSPATSSVFALPPMILVNC